MVKPIGHISAVDITRSPDRYMYEPVNYYMGLGLDHNPNPTRSYMANRYSTEARIKILMNEEYAGQEAFRGGLVYLLSEREFKDVILRVANQTRLGIPPKF